MSGCCVRAQCKAICQRLQLFINYVKKKTHFAFNIEERSLTRTFLRIYFHKEAKLYRIPKE